MRFVPYDPGFDPQALSPFEALKHAAADGGSTRLSGKQLPGAGVGNLEKNGSLMLSGCTAEAAGQAVRALSPKHLWLQNVRSADLALLSGQDGLVSLILSDMPALEDLSALQGIVGLEALVVEDCSRLVDFAVLAHLPELRLLRLSGPKLGGGWKTVDLAPISGLCKLRHLSLAGLRSADEKLVALAALPPLELLELDGGWPARELARMAARQPHLAGKSTFLKPLVASAQAENGGFFDIDPTAYTPEMVTYMAAGKRGASGLQPRRDAEKISRIRRIWQGWLVEFSDCPDLP